MYDRKSLANRRPATRVLAAGKPDRYSALEWLSEHEMARLSDGQAFGTRSLSCITNGTRQTTPFCVKLCYDLLNQRKVL